eukprot:TRINITY_DN567_c0_g2_i1.p1 TRINITY_DN567_c0_g2~~TRINITY_DN567_c0_g2_i1.p1  ORF type:complete len:238 (+),score=42.69 TRINITY_DN567_c0_g2_i1:122-835(+)
MEELTRLVQANAQAIQKLTTDITPFLTEYARRHDRPSLKYFLQERTVFIQREDVKNPGVFCSGTGSVIGKYVDTGITKSLILTNIHVAFLSNYIGRRIVTTHEGIRYEAILIYTSDNHDFAILEIEADLPSFPISVSAVDVLTPVYSLGLPFSYDQPMLLEGKVASKDPFTCDIRATFGTSGSAILKIEGKIAYLVGIITGSRDKLDVLIDVISTEEIFSELRTFLSSLSDVSVILE